VESETSAERRQEDNFIVGINVMCEDENGKRKRKKKERKKERGRNWNYITFQYDL